MSKKQKRKSYLRKKFSKKMQKKLVMLFVGIILAFVILVGRITYINATSGDKYTKLVLDQQQYDSRTIPFKRGDILDANGTKLATSERVYNVILDVKVLMSKDEQIKPTLEVLEDCFVIQEKEVREVMDKNPDSRYTILKKGVSYAKAQEFLKIDEDDDEYPDVAGVWLEEDYIRSYPYNTLASDVVGFTVSGNMGNSGLESSYNSVLNGTDGREYGYLDTDASVERIVKEPTNGHSIVSTIDVNLQTIVEKHIIKFNEKHRNEKKKGTGSKNTGVIIMNPSNGEILAEASYPNYDLNDPRDLTDYFSKKDIAKMSDEQKLKELNALWKNFCVSDTYEPGSTIKPFTIANGLDSGKLKGNETYTCEGVLHVGDHDIHCNKRSGHGTQTIKEVMENSCNVGLMQIGVAIGVEDFTKYQKIFGFGEYTGIDLPGEGSTESLLYNKDNMNVTSLATNAFGQNFNVTMTQMAAGFSSIVNGGNYYEPHVVKQVQDENGNVVKNIDPVLLKKTISKDTSTQVKKYLNAVVEEGTGKTAQVKGYDVGGKTGTAEKLPRGNKKYLISFIGYAPQENPEVVIYVVIDEPNVDRQDNSRLVTELSADIMKEAFPYLNVTKKSKK